MPLHESGEDYLEAILVLHEQKGNVRSIDVAQHLGYSKPSVSRAMSILRSSGYITMERDGRILLTEAGKTAAEAGDETALAVCRAYVEELAEGTASLINILRPEAVAFGGGVAGAPEHLLLEPLRRRIGALCFSRHGGRATRILRAELGNDAGVIGAALLGRVI